jgi:RNA recognition motif-containing protein
MMTTTEEQIKEVFERFKPNSIERVKKLKDYAFVHFKQRDDALHAMNLMNGNSKYRLEDRRFYFILGCELDGSIVEVTLAKPVDKNQYFRFTRGVSPSGLTTNLPVMIYSIFCTKKRNFLLVCNTSRYTWSGNCI